MRHRREELCLSGALCAKMAGIDGSYLCQIETQATRVSPRVLAALARALQVHINWFEDPNTPVPPLEIPDAPKPIAWEPEVEAGDGGSAAQWLKMLWDGALKIAANPGPGPEGLQAACKTVAALATAARKFITADQLADSLESDDVTKAKFWADAAPYLELHLASMNVPEEKRKEFLGYLKAA